MTQGLKKNDSITMKNYKNCEQRDSSNSPLDLSFIDENSSFGVFRCKNDIHFTLTYTNKGFLDIVEYTKEELLDSFDNSFAKLIYSKDLPKVIDSTVKRKSIDINIDIEFRIVTKSGKLLWILSKGEMYKNENSEYEYSSIIVDVTNQKRTMTLLTKKAEHDQLTNLYNRVTAQKLVEDFIKNEENATRKSAFLALDIDDFKNLNDTYGHPYADTILVDISNAISCLHRKTDILCRAGGDEMIIFLKDIKNVEVAMDKASDLLRTVAEVSKRRSNGTPITCSIGISIYPDDGTSFDELYNKADIALYHSKESGKGRFSLYNELPHAKRNIKKVVKHTIIDSNKIEPETDGDWLLWYAFNLLNESKDIPAAIQLILSLLGQKTGVDRVYIFEFAENHTRFRNTFEWCNEGITPEIENLQNLTVESVKAILEKFEKTNGLFYCKDIEEFYPDSLYYVLKPQGIKAVLQCELKSFGKSLGMLGLDDCTSKKYWSLKLVDLLTKFSHLISIYLSAYRLKQKLNLSDDDRFPSL